MSRSETDFFRAGYVISLDAWDKYFADGHGRRIGADNIVDCVQSSGKDDKEEEREDDKGKPVMSEEEKQPPAEQQSNFYRVVDFRRAFRGLYRRASPEVKSRIVLPHSEYSSHNN